MRRSSQVANRFYLNEIEGKASDNVQCNSDLTFHGGGKIQTTSNTDLTILPNGTGITIIGDAGSPGNLGTPTNDDFFVSGRMELDNTFHFDAGGFFKSNEKLYFNINTSSSYMLPYLNRVYIDQNVNSTATTFMTIRGGSGNMTATSGLQDFLVINPDFAQSDTAGYRGVLIDVTETSLGSGQTTPLEIKVAGDVEFQVHSNGQMVWGCPTSAATLANAQISCHLDEAGENLVFDIKESDGTAETVTIAYDP